MQIYSTCFNSFLFNQFSGNSTVIWKSVNSNRIISAGEVIIRKDHRFLLTDGYNLQIRNLKKSDAGKSLYTVF